MEKKNIITIRELGAVDTQSHTVTHVVNTKDLDRHRSIVLPKGAKIENYLKNPIVLWGHNGKEVPIGKCIDITIDENYVMCTTQFNEKDPLAMKVFNAFADGYLNGWSIGFIPMKEKIIDLVTVMQYSLPLKESELTGNETLIEEWEMLEYSAVSIPANPAALKELQVRGLIEEVATRDVNTEVKVEEKKEEVKIEEKKEEVKVEEKAVVLPENKAVNMEEMVQKQTQISKDETLKQVELSIGEYERVIDSQFLIFRKEIDELKAKLDSAINSGKEKDEVISKLGLAIDELNKSAQFSNIEKIREMEANKGKTNNNETGWFRGLINK